MKYIDFRLEGEGEDNPYKYHPKNPIEQVTFELITEIERVKERLLVEVVEILLGRIPTGDELSRRARRIVYKGMAVDEEVVELDGIPILWFRGPKLVGNKYVLDYRRGVRDEPNKT